MLCQRKLNRTEKAVGTYIFIAFLRTKLLRVKIVFSVIIILMNCSESYLAVLDWRYLWIPENTFFSLLLYWNANYKHIWKTWQRCSNIKLTSETYRSTDLVRIFLKMWYSFIILFFIYYIAFRDTFLTEYNSFTICLSFEVVQQQKSL